jgi:hypothetical protein
MINHIFYSFYSSLLLFFTFNITIIHHIMGQLFSNKPLQSSFETDEYHFFDSEFKFWDEYYKQTTDYSVGYATTWIDGNEYHRRETSRILQKWTIRPGKFYFPKCYKNHPSFEEKTLN